MHQQNIHGSKSVTLCNRSERKKEKNCALDCNEYNFPQHVNKCALTWGLPVTGNLMITAVATCALHAIGFRPPQKLWPRDYFEITRHYMQLIYIVTLWLLLFFGLVFTAAWIQTRLTMFTQNQSIKAQTQKQINQLEDVNIYISFPMFPMILSFLSSFFRPDSPSCKQCKLDWFNLLFSIKPFWANQAFPNAWPMYQTEPVHPRKITQ